MSIPVDVDVLHPVVETAVEETKKVTLDGDLEGKVVGFLDNRKPNAQLLFEQTGELLQQKYNAAGYKILRKKNASIPAEDEMIRELADECDLVITGSGD